MQNIKFEQLNILISPLAEEDGSGYEASFPDLGRTVVGYGETQIDALIDLMQINKLFIESLDLDEPTIEKFNSA